MIPVHRLSSRSAIVLLACFLAVVAVLAFIVTITCHSISSGDRDEISGLLVPKTDSLMLWLDACEADGLDRWESYLCYVDYLNGPPLLRKPCRVC